MWYIVGLGNPGAQYTNSRHNVGWQVLDTYRATVGLPEPVPSAALSGAISCGVVASEEVTLLYPDTFMNNSGAAVKKLVTKKDAARLVVVYDDIDIPFGEIKISFAKNSGGHNGIASIIDALGTKEFVRVRIGIAPRRLLSGAVARPAPDKQAQFVLGRFSLRERTQVPTVLKDAATAIAQIIAHGHEYAMNQQGGK